MRWYSELRIPRAAPAALFLCLLPAACGERASVRAQQQLQEPIPCEQPERLADLPRALVEASGIVASRQHPEVLWVHNDSDPHLYAVDRSGRQLGRVRLAHEIDDWEDLALAECAAGTCLYLADIGDNQHERPQVTIYRIPEPAPADTLAAAPALLQLRYPDGPRDAEALFVLPGERVHIVSKGRKGPIALYRAPGFEAGRTVTLEHARALTPGLVQFPDMVTGAALSADGAWLALRTYSYVDLFPVAGDTLAARAALRVPLAPLKEPQGEGVGFGAAGELLLVSEKNGRTAPLSRVRCQLR